MIKPVIPGLRLTGGPEKWSRKIAILGSTGSIGRQTLEVCAGLRKQGMNIEVVALSAGRNWQLLREQALAFRPQLLSLAREEDAAALRATLPVDYRPEIRVGAAGLKECAVHPEVEVVVAASSGTAGLEAVHAALLEGKDVALANKEVMVAAGPVMIAARERGGGLILPVDSEHSAVWQCLQGAGPEEVARVILTASGGPFLRQPADLTGVTVEEALAHPNWRMGPKVTIDSATLMNKGLEVIETHFLFGIPYDRIGVLVHPQSIVHALVEFNDGSVFAQLGRPDMRVPIQYALTYPLRRPGPVGVPDLAALGSLTFEEPDCERFPCLKLAYSAGRAGGSAPAVLNAANEVAVTAFLGRRLSLPAIAQVVEAVLEQHVVQPLNELADVLYWDNWARREAERIITRMITVV